MTLKSQKKCLFLIISLSFFSICSKSCYSTKALIWEPDEGHAYGHVALLTDRYYMSFWPANQVMGAVDQGLTFFHKVPGSFVLEPEFDIENEEKEPLIYDIKVSTKKINKAYEALLRKNYEVLEEFLIPSLRIEKVKKYNIDICDFNNRVRVHNEKAEYWRSSFLGCFCSNATKTMRNFKDEYSSQEVKYPQYSVVSHYDVNYGWPELGTNEHSCTTFAANLLSYGAEDHKLGINYKTTAMEWVQNNNLTGVKKIFKPFVRMFDGLVQGGRAVREKIDDKSPIIMTVPDFKKMIINELGAKLYQGRSNYRQISNMSYDKKKKVNRY